MKVKIGKMNKSKTKMMIANDIPICQHYSDRESWKLRLPRKTYSTKHKTLDKEIPRRIKAGWKAFAKHRIIFNCNTRTCLKRQMYNACILPAKTYDADTWALASQAKYYLAAAQTHIKWSMLNITYRDIKTNIWLREKTKVTYVIEQDRRRQCSWAGYVTRIQDNW